jgi:hypothetical protein
MHTFIGGLVYPRFFRGNINDLLIAWVKDKKTNVIRSNSHGILFTLADEYPVFPGNSLGV